MAASTCPDATWPKKASDGVLFGCSMPFAYIKTFASVRIMARVPREESIPIPFPLGFRLGGSLMPSPLPPPCVRHGWNENTAGGMHLAPVRRRWNSAFGPRKRVGRKDQGGRELSFFSIALYPYPYPYQCNISWPKICGRAGATENTNHGGHGGARRRVAQVAPGRNR